MKSADLIQEGFKIWYPFNLEAEQILIANLPRTHGVYIIRRKHHFGRFIGESDISFIGSATKKNGLKERIRQYYHPGPTQRTNQRILKLLNNIKDFELSYKEVASIVKAREIEKSILQRFEEEHGELPPLSRQG